MAIDAWMSSRRFHIGAWQGDPALLRLRQHVMTYVLMVSHCLEVDELRAQLDEDDVEKLCAPVDAWFRKVALRHPAGHDEPLATYAMLGIYLSAKMGREDFLTAIAEAEVATDRDHDHAERSDGEEQLASD